MQNKVKELEDEMATKSAQLTKETQMKEELIEKVQQVSWFTPEITRV